MYRETEKLRVVQKASYQFAQSATMVGTHACDEEAEAEMYSLPAALSSFVGGLDLRYEIGLKGYLMEAVRLTGQ